MTRRRTTGAKLAMYGICFVRASHIIQRKVLRLVLRFFVDVVVAVIHKHTFPIHLSFTFLSYEG